MQTLQKIAIILAEKLRLRIRAYTKHIDIEKAEGTDSPLEEVTILVGTGIYPNPEVKSKGRSVRNGAWFRYLG